MVVGPIDGRWAFVDHAGKVKFKLPKQVDDARAFDEGRAVVSFRGSCGYIDSAGASITKLRFQECDDFSEGLASVFDRGWKYIDLSGRVVLNVKYFQVGPFVNGLASVTEGKDG